MFQLYLESGEIAWQFPKNHGSGVRLGLVGLAAGSCKSARLRLVRLDSRYTRLRLFYSLASGGESVTIIRKSPDCLFSVAVFETMRRSHPRRKARGTSK